MRTILIVDDEPAARYGLRRALESQYRVAEAESAEAAREALPREKPDLVLLDVIMPGLARDDFMDCLQRELEAATARLCEEGRAELASTGLQDVSLARSA